MNNNNEWNNSAYDDIYSVGGSRGIGHFDEFESESPANQQHQQSAPFNGRGNGHGHDVGYSSGGRRFGEYRSRQILDSEPITSSRVEEFSAFTHRENDFPALSVN